jgi:WD40 repeat protein
MKQEPAGRRRAEAEDETVDQAAETVDQAAETVLEPQPQTKSAGAWVERVHAGLLEHEGGREQAAKTSLGQDRFRVVRELGRGGMGVVMEVEDTLLGRRAALKMMTAGDLASPAQLERFRIEGRAAARLRHPNVVSVLEVGELRGNPYLLMDLVDGESLEDRLERDGPLESREAARIMLPLAGALAYAHSNAILHRDLKPANVLLAKDGQPLLTDFGLAKDMSKEAKRLTVSGAIMGTPSFMPPEQARGQLSRVDRRSDVYSLGATLYSMLTGQPPFEGESLGEILYAVVHDDPLAPHRLRSEVDRDLETICLKCLEKEPEQRYDTAQDLADDLERYLSDTPILARPSTVTDWLRKWRRRNRRLVSAVVVVLLLGLVSAGVGTAGFVQRLSEEKVLAKEALALAEERGQEADRQRKLAEDRGAAAEEQRKLAEDRLEQSELLLGHALEGKGRRAIENKDWRRAAVFLTAALEKDDRPRRRWPALTALSNAWRLRATFPHEGSPDRMVWSPDGQRLACVMQFKEITRVWSARSVTTLKNTSSVAWSPDGTVLATGEKGGGVHLRDGATLAEIAFMSGDTSNHSVKAISWSPDGRTIASSDDYDIFLWDVRALALKTIFRGGGACSIWELTWSPDGAWIVGTDFSNMEKVPVWEVATGKRTLLQQTGKCIRAQWSPARNRLALVSVEKKAVPKYSDPPKHNPLARTLPPPPKKISNGQEDARSSLRIWDAARGELTVDVTHPGEVLDMAWAPNASQVATASADDHLRLFGADSGELKRDLSTQDRSIRSVAWSPEGSHLAATGWDGAIWLWTAAGEPIAVLEDQGETSPAWGLTWSPDGSSLASAHEDSVKIFDVSYPMTLSGPTEGSLRYARKALAPDGSLLAYGFATHRSKELAFEHLGALDRNEIWVWDGKTGQLRLRLRGHTGTLQTLAWSPDASLLASAASGSTVRVWSKRGDLRATLEGQEDDFELAWSATNRILAFRGDEATAIRLWEPTRGAFASLELKGNLEAMAWNPADSRLATCSDDALSVWDGKTGTLIATLTGAEGAEAEVMAWSPDGGRLASGWDDGTVRLWSGAAGAQATSQRAGENVYGMAWSPDGSLLVTRSDSHDLRLWDGQTGKAVATLEGHGDDATAFLLAWSPDGSRLATADSEELILWDAGGAQVAKLSAQGGLLDAAWLGPHVLATPQPGGRVALWDGRSGASLGALDGHDAQERSALASSEEQGREERSSSWFGLELTISGDRSRLVVAGERGVRVWNVQEVLSTPSALRALAEARTGLRLEGLDAVPASRD